MSMKLEAVPAKTTKQSFKEKYQGKRNEEKQIVLVDRGIGKLMDIICWYFYFNCIYSCLFFLYLFKDNIVLWLKC